MPKCKDCGQEMFYLCEIAEGDIYEKEQGMNCHKLYQCPEDKTIVVE